MEDLLKQIEKEIRRIEDAMKKGKKYGQIKMRGNVSKEAIRLVKRIKAYKKLTKKKRISKEEKEALIQYTPKQVKRSLELSPKALERRKKKFEKDYGFMNPIIEEDLKYGGPKRVAKRYGLIDEEKEKKEREKRKKEKAEKETTVLGPVTVKKEETKEGEWSVFTYPTLTRCGWPEIRDTGIGKWRRKSDSFLYINREWMFDKMSEMVDMDGFLRYGSDGADHNRYEFFELAIPAAYEDDILFDPNQDGAEFFVYKNEWDEVEELSPDYIITRRYKRKK